MLRAIRWDDKSCAEFWEEFSEAVVADDNVATVATSLCDVFDRPQGGGYKNRRALANTRRFEFCLDYFFGEAAGLAASFFAPFAAFTSMLVAVIV